jgi:NAD(P)-dependent dehydrogenase (short-subunit alcohol dehydrogenase family)
MSDSDSATHTRAGSSSVAQAGAVSPVDLSGRCALVTGAARRTGRALALALARAGADVAVHCHHSREEALGVVAEIESMGRRSTLVQVDLRELPRVESAFAAAASELGRLDILVNNVGTIVWKDFDDLSAEEWRECIDGTLFVTLFASRAALPTMRAQRFGRIINILDADADAWAPVPYATAYKIGKKAAFSLTKTLAQTEAPFGITCNAVSPGTLEDSGEKPALERMPAGRYGRYADVESAVLFLAGDAASYVTGAHLKVSGGYLI